MTVLLNYFVLFW